MTVQLKEKSHHSKPATAGPSADDRFGAGPIATNAEARIIKGDIVGGRTRITIARGAIHGVRADMEGHVTSGGQTIATFQIDQVKPNVSYAFTSATIDRLDANAMAVINPTRSHAPPTHELRSRVIHVQTDPAGSRITIARGSDHGIHRGMRGTLVSNTGAEHYTFTIELVDGNRSYATVETTVAEVNNFPNVILRPLHAKHAAAIQRRATGNASTADVQATADAGVASASSRLPHFDTIQRAFGKHDISNIQSQVGGTATPAAASLGAHAYATGNRVAFASSPDLHTAAHEAAHTIQQRRGAVGFQGLGAADDEHEHHADAVADAVVAGQSAEPLLDKLVGGSPSAAIQRKPTEPSPYIRAAIASLRAAEYELDRGEAELSQKTQNSNELQRMQYHWTTTLDHLDYAAKCIEATTSNEPGLLEQMDETSIALAAYATASRDSPVSSQIRPLLDRTHASHDRVRWLIGVPEETHTLKRERERERGTDDHYESNVVDTALAVVEQELERLLVNLSEAPPEQREAMLVAGAAVLRPHLRQAVANMRRLDGNARKDRKDMIARISQPLLHTLRLVEGRPAGGTLVTHLDTATELVEGMRVLVGLGPIGKTAAATLTRDEEKAERVENSGLQAATNSLHAAYDRLKDGYAAGIREFEKLAIIKEVEPPSFWQELGRAVVIAALGHLTGGIGAIVLARVVDAAVATVIKEVMIDGTQGILGPITEGAFSSSSGPDREALFAGFVRSLDLHAADLARQQKSNVDAAVKDNKITVAQLDAMKGAVDAAIHDAHAIVLQTSARSWGTLLVQAKSGAEITRKAGVPVATRTSMDAYFGNSERKRQEEWRERGDSKWGSDGALRVTVLITDHDDGSAPIVQIDSVDANGLNRAMCLAMIRDGENGFKRLDAVAVPLEIAVWKGTTGARLAIDESGAIRDVFRWNGLRKWNRDDSRAPQRHTYEEPEGFWGMIRGIRLSAGLVK